MSNGKSHVALIAAHELRRASGEYDVPCNGCTRCCHGDAMRILPHEDASQWATEPHDRLSGARMLAHKPNGDCYYLGERGCSIQQTKPQMCMEMDCRKIAQRISWTQARKLSEKGALSFDVWTRGRVLLAEQRFAERSEARIRLGIR